MRAHMPESGQISATSLLEKQRQRAAELLKIGNPQQRLAAIVDGARKRQPLPDVFRTEANRVQGCLVRTWVVCEFRHGRCYFRSDSDAAMLKSLLGIVCDTFSGHSAEEISSDEGNFLAELKVLHQLAESRQRTLANVMAQVRAFAQAHAVSATAGSNL
jgi:cysteine desulfuration protein SufE